MVFTAKTLGKQFANTIKPFVRIFIATTMANRRVAAMIRAAQTGVAAVPAVSKIADFIPRAANLAAGRSAAELNDKTLQRIDSVYELQSNMVLYKGTFDDFNDRAIQFGYLVLFAPAYPLAPGLALVNNILEIRTSAYRMCNAYQRPPVKNRSSIGSWKSVLNVLGFLAVLTNASMIAFVGGQEAARLNIVRNRHSGTSVGGRQTASWPRSHAQPCR